MKRVIFRRLSEDTKITTRFPKRHITRCLPFSAIKYWGISKLDLIVLYLKEWMLVNGQPFQAPML